MIHGISGKPRGGKSLFGVRMILDELLHGSRPIITNSPLLLGRLNEYLHEKYPEKNCNAIGRIILLPDEKVGGFFRIRPDIVLPDVEVRPGLIATDFSKRTDDGVLYVLDEIHIYFNARAWAETGKGVLFYLSQHAKLGDDVIWITQAIGNVDKQFRSVTQDFTYIANLGKQKMGMFRLPSIFLRQTFLQPNFGEGKAMESGTFTLDVTGLASCYSTATGVGIMGRDADTKHKKKGLHYAWFIIGVIALVVIGMRVLPPALASMFIVGDKIKRETLVVTKAKVEIPERVVNVTNKLKDIPIGVVTDDDGNVRYVTGVMRWGRKITFLFSDKTILQDVDISRVSVITDKNVVVDGEIYRRKQ